MLRSYTFCLLFLIPCSALTADPYLFANESVGFPVVSTTSGKFAGLTIRNTNVWIGIPYAAPPVGALRWQKAQPYVVNSSQNGIIRNATHYAPMCPQMDLDGTVSSTSDEDCLYLNIWAPSMPSPRSTGYPVMLWIHGGGLVAGSSTTVIYDGLSWTNAAIQVNRSFIMVSMNYRLNVLGFFAQSALVDENEKAIANQGITDQRMAMKWVQDNIAQFGGDKNSVTLMGESAGAESVCIHIVSPLSAGLFHTGIMQSGPCDNMIYLRDKSFAYSTANNLALRVGCNMTDPVQQLDCLKSINSTKLVAAIGHLSVPSSTSLAFSNIEKVIISSPFSLIVDEIEIPVHPLRAFLSGDFNRVRVLIGANRDEFVFRGLYDALLISPVNAQNYLTCILPIVTYNNSELQVLYDPSRFNDNYTRACVALFSEYVFICGTRRMAGYMSGQPTYLYTYDHAPEASWLSSPSIVLWPGAYHGAELFSLFQTLGHSFYGDSIFHSSELDLANSIRLYWTNMITTGQPNNDFSPTWPQYSSSNDLTLVFVNNITTSVFIDAYPNCDAMSDAQVKAFGEYLGLNVTCETGNKCFIVDPSTTTSSTPFTFSRSKNNNLSCFQLTLIFLFFVYCDFS